MILALTAPLIMKSLKKEIELFEKKEILNALRECSWIISKAARKLGITERMIGYKIKKYGIEIKEAAYDGADVSDADVNDPDFNQKKNN